MSSPYTSPDLYRVVALHPHQMNTNIYSNLKENLKKDIIRKCIDGGYVCKIYDIKNYADGDLPAEDFTGSAKYNVQYTAKICKPIDGLSLICKINIISRKLIKAYNGPIKVIVENLKHFPDKFGINQDGNLYCKDTKKVVKKDDIIKVKMDWQKLDIGSTYILVMAVIEDMANKDEIKQFEKDMDADREDRFVSSNSINEEDEDTTANSDED